MKVREGPWRSVLNQFPVLIVCKVDKLAISRCKCNIDIASCDNATMRSCLIRIMPVRASGAFFIIRLYWILYLCLSWGLWVHWPPNAALPPLRVGGGTIHGIKNISPVPPKGKTRCKRNGEGITIHDNEAGIISGIFYEHGPCRSNVQYQAISATSVNIKSNLDITINMKHMTYVI